ncbi:helix-turn-helix domain-containing protein [Lentzea sp. NPDC005914]|uniref:helix-turn-helix domain-containing protein n=1 Tax=Lentzea sp. NPDC005914 TaxID=3154572 RepID=UPI003405082E
MWDSSAVDSLELLLHPVRLRIVYALSGDSVRTTAEICERLSDVPKTSVYRHVGLLLEGGVLEVVEEKRVRGAVERHYRLRQDRVTIAPEEGRRMSLDDHRAGFATAMAALLAEFNAYLDRPGAMPFDDAVAYRQGVLWLNDEETGELLEDLRAAFVKRAANRPGDGRRPRLMSLIQFPSDHS